MLKLLPLICVIAVAGAFWPSQVNGDDDMSKARDALDADKYDTAIRLFTNAIEAGNLSQEELLSAHSNRGMAYSRVKQYNRAIADYSIAIDIKPGHADYYVNRGVAYNCKKEYAKAIADYSKAIEIDPKDASTYYFRGYSYSDKGQNDKAIADFSKRYCQELWMTGDRFYAAMALMPSTNLTPRITSGSNALPFNCRHLFSAA